MFGQVLSVSDSYIMLENLSKKIVTKLIGVHIVFESADSKVVGEIVEIDSELIKVSLVGEFSNGKFLQGIIKKPNVDAKVRVIYTDEVNCLVGSQDKDPVNELYLGKSTVYDGFNISIGINDFFANHFAIIGNTGSGKSCSLARIIQNLFYRENNVAKNANIVIFDVYGEYNSSFRKINEMGKVKSKSLTTKIKFADSEVVQIPPYFLEVDDLAILLNADDPQQLPILEKALKYVCLFAEEESSVREYKDNIIAKALIDILSSGKPSTQIRDQIIAVLTTFFTDDINLDSEIRQPGYVRTLKQCLNVDTTGKINTMQLVVEFLEPYASMQPGTYKPDKRINYTLPDLYNALEFALISEGVLKSDKVFDKSNILKVRLEGIINSESIKYFEVSDYIDKATFIKKLFTTPTGDKAQLLNINLNYIDERFAKMLTKIYSKLFFDYAISLEDRGSFPVQIILEEAHRYVQNDNDIKVIGYNIFDRITKEGRKYGVILGLITQRPSELSNTALSQCSNFLVFRMFHPKDIEIVSNITFNVRDETITKLKALRPGCAIGFGTGFKLPQIIQLDLPDPMPTSTSSNISDTWFDDKPKVEVQINPNFQK